MISSPASADFPFESQYADVLGSRVHYVEQGTGEPKDFYETATNYCGALARSGLPALLLYYPDMAPAVEAYRSFLSDLTAIEVDGAHHFMPEDQPERVGLEVARWVQSQTKSR